MLSQSIHPRRTSKRARRTTRSTWIAVVTAAALTCVLAACGQAAPGAGAPAGHVRQDQRAVFDRTLPGIGVTLVDRSGMTIYSPEQEADGKIACTGGCLAFWFPVTVRSGDILSLPAAFTGRLGKIRRADDGKTQLTYNGKPLYTFRLDTAAGQAHGNNFMDHFGGASFTWHAITAAGQAKAKSSPSPGY